ncbi:hypothetical protein K493DRAFT_313359 [Basidiobolus meristosporus CBS 931.73]|uniref:Protein PBN1 n=1 Tax=Basidiobolus meristosporus CBS 931.73 TaxID=1314790 RepID=A0A1Y1YM13_9FUNG|nr:hypothetical protein K493DRAFT_313359 [Basidiobolus meristosporus CBS 931.73]|eukprot:ORX99042.1 hypothetical protein K493DRAFT_313359 [Basidiobolus meristosporus CBS 931.73]
MLSKGTFHIEPSQSFHPNFFLTFPSSELASPNTGCQLNVFYDLPRDIILDPYQLKDLESTLGSAKIYGKVDLEVPVSEISENETPSLLLSPVIPSQEPVELKVPVHMRYQYPAAKGKGTHEKINIQAPYVFWSCPQDVTLADKFEVDPQPPYLVQKEFLRTDNIYPLVLSNQNMTQEILVPKGQLEVEQWVQTITLGCIGLSFVWVVFTISLKAFRNFRLAKED